MKKVIIAFGVCGIILLPSASSMENLLRKNNTTKKIVQLLSPRPLLVDPTYEIVNGMSGMMRDIILQLVNLIGYSKSIRNIFGMCLEHFRWKNHRLFVNNNNLPTNDNVIKLSIYNAKKFLNGYTPYKVIAVAEGLKLTSKTVRALPIPRYWLKEEERLRLALEAVDALSTALKADNFKTPLRKAAYKYAYVFCWKKLLKRYSGCVCSYLRDELTEIPPNIIERLFYFIYLYGGVEAVASLSDNQITTMAHNEIRCFGIAAVEALEKTARKRNVLTEKLVETINWVKELAKEPNIDLCHIVQQSTPSDILNEQDEMLYYWTTQYETARQDACLAWQNGQSEEQYALARQCNIMRQIRHLFL